MTLQRFTLVPGWIDTAGRTRTWELIDSKGKIRAEMTCKKEAATVIEALNTAELLIQNCGRVGVLVAEYVCWQE